MGYTWGKSGFDVCEFRSKCMRTDDMLKIIIYYTLVSAPLLCQGAPQIGQHTWTAEDEAFIKSRRKAGDHGQVLLPNRYHSIGKASLSQVSGDSGLKCTEEDEDLARSKLRTGNLFRHVIPGQDLEKSSSVKSSSGGLSSSPHSVKTHPSSGGSFSFRSKITSPISGGSVSTGSREASSSSASPTPDLEARPSFFSVTAARPTYLTGRTQPSEGTKRVSSLKEREKFQVSKMVDKVEQSSGVASSNERGCRTCHLVHG